MNQDNPSEEVARHFETEWHDYDEQIRVSIPSYDQALSTVADVIESSDLKPKRILDLGVGTGNLSDLLLKTWPQAHLTGIDLVQDFINVARKRLSRYADRSTLVRIDVADFDFTGEYDLVVSSFMFHHLADELKRMTYSRALSCLRSQGTLINADYVDSASSFYSRVFYDLRLSFIQRQGGSVADYIEHQKFEIPTPMEVQLSWLRISDSSILSAFGSTLIWLSSVAARLDLKRMKVPLRESHRTKNSKQDSVVFSRY